MTAENATIETLRRWSHVLLWVSIVLPFLGALAAGARYYVERYEKRLTAQVTARAIRQASDEATAARSDAATTKEAQAQIGQELIKSQQDLTTLRQKTAPRRLSAAERDKMLPILANLRGKPVAVACRLMDGESCDYALDLSSVE